MLNQQMLNQQVLKLNFVERTVPERSVPKRSVRVCRPFTLFEWKTRSAIERANTQRAPVSPLSTSLTNLVSLSPLFTSLTKNTGGYPQEFQNEIESL
jgi:hypothetical protein